MNHYDLFASSITMSSGAFAGILLFVIAFVAACAYKIEPDKIEYDYQAEEHDYRSPD